MKHQHFRGLSFALALALAATSHLALAQVDIKPTAHQIDAPAAAATSSSPTLDLGEVPGTTEPIRVASTAQPTTSGTAAATTAPASAPVPKTNPPKAATAGNAKKPRGPASVDDIGGPATADNGTERVQFERAPVRVMLTVSRERLITFPNPVALQMPVGAADLLDTQVIERTAYVRARGPFTNQRIVAEDLVTGQMIPLDISADPKYRSFSSELEIFYKGVTAPRAARSAAGNASDSGESDDQALDMVGLTRYAAQAIYAPRRLMPSAPGVQSIPVAPTVLSGLLRGQRVSAVPIGQWRSGALYVTAVRLTNLETHPLDLDLDQIRGSWLAATPQHRRLLAAGSDWDTTTLYLVCGQPFDHCK